ncbi:MAG TPA: diguanylate cyclase, partial [Chloroflexota bacterium]|nr:diguanylate cyclase [Chloroflexota bacterium]
MVDTMDGARQIRRFERNNPPRNQRWLIDRLQLIAWVAVGVFVVTFMLLDVVLVATIEDSGIRLGLRWLVIGSVCAALTATLSRRTIDMVTRSVRAERAARSEAEALAEMAAAIATGRSIAETLSITVQASARLLGEDARCSVALPQANGNLRYVAWSEASGERLAQFEFPPHDGLVGRALTERRVILVDNLLVAQYRADVARGSEARALMLAPLIAEERVLGILSAASPHAGAFGAQDERLLTSIARHLTVALAAAEARTSAQREASEKAAIIDQMADAVLVADSSSRVVECNRAAAALFDEHADNLIGVVGRTVPWTMFSADNEPVGLGQGPLTRALRGETVAGEYRIRTRSGMDRWVSATATPLRATDGALTGGILVLRDIAEWRRAESALRDSEERYRRLVELCPDPIVVYCDSKIVYANAATVILAGADTAADLFGRSMLDFVHPDFQESVVERSRTILEQGEGQGVNETTLRRLDGELIQIESTTMPIMFEGRPAIQAVLRDVTERRRAEAALAYQAMHDALTGLPNRVLLLDRLEQAIVSSRRDGTELGLLLLDLDRFKEVNDTLGHHAGDLLLQQVGTRLRSALRQGDTIARLGGDEFAMILPATDAVGVVTVVENLLRRLQAPFSVEGQPVVVGASIGIAVSPEHGQEPDALMRRADVAMYVAKRSNAGFAIYRAEQDRNSPDRLAMIGELRQAIDEGELVLHYQPKIDLRTKELSGVEALVRWEHPLRGLLGPDQFVPIAEQAGLIDSLSRWVLRSALVQAGAWRRAGLEIPIAINLSMRSLQDDRLPDMIAELLAAVRLPSTWLVVEIT